MRYYEVCGKIEAAGPTCEVGDRAWFRDIMPWFLMLRPGSRLAHYEILGTVGAGGMGEVFRARDLNLPREVAIKILPDKFLTDADRQRRFRHEAEILSKLSHPNLLTVYDFGDERNLPYLVTELLTGQTLKQRLDSRAPLPYRTAIRYAAEIASGLAEAHQHEITHRDLKPINIFITEDDRVKILDFGLAKEILRPIQPNDPTPQQHTPYGATWGTPGYKSPEQALCEAIDQRSDIFALGVVLYEMIARRRAFLNDQETVVAELPPLPRGVSPTLEWTVHRCLEKNRERRFFSAHDLELSLRGELDTLERATRTIPGTPAFRIQRRMLAASIAIVLVGAAAAAGWLFAKRNVLPAAPRFVQLTFRSQERQPNLAPDGKTFAFVSDVSGNDDIYVQRVGGRELNLTKDSTYPDTEPAFSPDGTQIAFRSERDSGGIFVMGATGEEPRRVSQIGYNPSWSPDGNYIVVGTDDIGLTPGLRERISDLWLIDVKSGASRMLFKGDAVQPSWSPHGHRIAYWALIGNGGQRDLFTIDPHAENPASTVRRITADQALDWNPIWSPDGNWLYFGSDRGGTMNIWRVAIAEASGRVTGPPQPVPMPSRFATNITIARGTGEIGFADSSATATFWRIPFDPVAVRATGEATPIMSGALIPYGASSYGPDGSFAFSSSGVQEDVYLMDVNGALRRLTRDLQKDRVPVFSLDGSLIYFYSQRDDRYEVWSIQPDGNGIQRVSWTEGRPVWLPQPLPNHNALFASNEAGTWILRFEGGKIRKKEALPDMSDREAKMIAAASSPDGAQLIGLVRKSGPMFGLWTYSMASGSYEHIVAKGTDPDWGSPLNMVWLPQAQSQVLARFGRKLIVIDVKTKTAENVRLPTSVRSVGAFSLSRDGKTLQVIEPSRSSMIWMMRN